MPWTGESRGTPFPALLLAPPQQGRHENSWEATQRKDALMWHGINRWTCQLQGHVKAGRSQAGAARACAAGTGQGKVGGWKEHTPAEALVPKLCPSPGEAGLRRKGSTSPWSLHPSSGCLWRLKLGWHEGWASTCPNAGATWGDRTLHILSEHQGVPGSAQHPPAWVTFEGVKPQMRSPAEPFSLGHA